MRSEIGKQLRPKLFRRLLLLFPDFKAVPGQRIRGFIWDFEALMGPGLMFRLTFQRHKYDDAFTLELTWAADGPALETAPFVDLREGVSGVAGRFRVGALWSRGGDYWWQVEPGTLSSLASGNAFGVLHAMLAPRRSLPADIEARIDAVVEDAIQRLDAELRPVMVALAADRGYSLTPGNSADSSESGSRRTTGCS